MRLLRRIRLWIIDQRIARCRRVIKRLTARRKRLVAKPEKFVVAGRTRLKKKK